MSSRAIQAGFGFSLVLSFLLSATISARAVNPTEVYAFPGGQNPYAGLIMGTNRNFYGTTPGGGANNAGTVFQITPDGQLIWSASFNKTNGSTPLGPLVQGADGSFYGTASSGGSKGKGNVYKVSPAGVISSLHSFNGSDGSTPYCGLVQTSNGSLWGTTSAGGSNNFGTIFRITPKGSFSNYFSFGYTNGANPNDGLALGKDGNLYGATPNGGQYGLGSIFRVGKSNDVSLLISFSGNNGEHPNGLIQARNKSFYGSTQSGGSNGVGTVFQFTLPSTLRTLATFNGINGAFPAGLLVELANGDLYGTTLMGGDYGVGTIFKISSRTNFSTVCSLSMADGAYPASALVQGIDGNVYGTSSTGGSLGNGNIFQIGGFPPAIVTRPASITNRAGSDAVFTVVASGSSPLLFQWKKGSETLADGGNISGSSSNTLVIHNISGDDAGLYSVRVANDYGTAAASASLSVLVDAKASITSPSANKRGTNTSWIISGTASDKAQPFWVCCWVTNINNGVVTVSDPVIVGTNLAKWSFPADLLPGTNIVAVQTQNGLHNNSPIATRTFFQMRRAQLTLSSTEGGTISGSGQVRGEAPPTNGAWLNIGQTYTLTAKPARNFVFTRWDNGLSEALPRSTLEPSLTFDMTPGLNLRAVFDTNLFVRMAGVYAGLIQDTNSVRPESSGRLTNFKVDSNGKYSAKLWVGGSSYAISGGFDRAGQTTVLLTNVNLTLVMRLDLYSTPRTLTGTLSSSNWTAQVNAFAASGSSPKTAATLLILPGTESSNAPVGYGYATTASKSGVLTLSGRLADGATLSDSQPITENGQFPFYASLNNKQGVLIGWLTITNGYVLSGDLTWVNASTNAGFNETVATAGSTWVAQKHAGLGTNGLALTVSGADIGSLTYTVLVDAKNKIIRQSGSNNSLSGSINSKGVVTLTIGTGIGKTTVKGYGAVLQGETTVGGAFQRGTNYGVFTLTPLLP